MSHPWKKTQRTATHLCSAIWTTIILPVILLSLRERPPRTNLTDQPHNHPRMLGHENSPCEWVTSHLSEDMGYAVSSMGVFGDPWTTNINELKSCSETQSNTTERHPTSCRLQRDKKKKFAGRDKWPADATCCIAHDLFHLFILRTSHESLFHKSCITQHPN